MTRCYLRSATCTQSWIQTSEEKNFGLVKCTRTWVGIQKLKNCSSRTCSQIQKCGQMFEKMFEHILSLSWGDLN